jgi:hypothetical protein
MTTLDLSAFLFLSLFDRLVSFSFLLSLVTHFSSSASFITLKTLFSPHASYLLIVSRFLPFAYTASPFLLLSHFYLCSFSFSQSKLSKFAAVRVLEDRAIVTLISNLERGSEVMATAFKVMERLGWVSHHTHHTTAHITHCSVISLISSVFQSSIVMF